MREIALTYGFVAGERAAVADLLREYEAGTGVSLCFQGFAGELAELPGQYAPPKGQMIFARTAADGLVGCVALRPVADQPDLCEMKRLYVRPVGRGTGLGRRLAVAALAEARRLGYARICLDTLFSMTAAQALYRALGFRQTGIGTSEPPVLLFARELAGTDADTLERCSAERLRG
jgi:ribosomal protein S18 acetylase RimI-like enzyme